MSSDSVTLTIEGEETSDELTVPKAMLDLLRDGEESDAQVIGDLASLGMAQRIHTAVHHSEGEPEPAIEEVHEDMMEDFENRFGQSFAELTGHDH